MKSNSNVRPRSYSKLDLGAFFRSQWKHINFLHACLANSREDTFLLISVRQQLNSLCRSHCINLFGDPHTVSALNQMWYIKF